MLGGDAVAPLLALAVSDGVTVSEIKGAPCTRCAHFHGRVHDFRRCAHGVCTFFEPFLIAIILEGCMEQFPGAQFYGKCTL